MKRLSPVIVLLLFASCSFKSESSLSTALDLAGNNRHEIQKVLDHYCKGRMNVLYMIIIVIAQ